MKLANSTDQLLYFPIGRTGTLNSSTNIKVTSAKLRVFKKKIHALPSGNHSSSTKAAIVCVYQLSEDLSTEKNFQDVARKLVALQSITLDGRNSWENFDISQTVQEWLEKPQTNFGLVLACPDCHLAGYFFHSTTHNPHKVLPCNSCHEMNNSQSNVDFQKNVAVLDVLVKELSQQRDKRSTMPNFNANPKSLDCTRGNKTRLCCRYSLVVSFKDIGWDWVVKPEKYKAHFCKGKCPVRQNKMYSNPHALIQSMMRVKGLARVPRPCCTPKKLGSLSLLHYNDHETPQLVVTRRKGMKVRTCGCS